VAIQTGKEATEYSTLWQSRMAQNASKYSTFCDNTRWHKMATMCCY